MRQIIRPRQRKGKKYRVRIFIHIRCADSSQFRPTAHTHQVGTGDGAGLLVIAAALRAHSGGGGGGDFSGSGCDCSGSGLPPPSARLFSIDLRECHGGRGGCPAGTAEERKQLVGRRARVAGLAFRQLWSDSAAADEVAEAGNGLGLDLSPLGPLDAWWIDGARTYSHVRAAAAAAARGGARLIVFHGSELPAVRSAAADALAAAGAYQLRVVVDTGVAYAVRIADSTSDKKAAEVPGAEKSLHAVAEAVAVELTEAAAPQLMSPPLACAYPHCTSCCIAGEQIFSQDVARALAAALDAGMVVVRTAPQGHPAQLHLQVVCLFVCARVYMCSRVCVCTG
jgi:hypothetical protein